MAAQHDPDGVIEVPHHDDDDDDDDDDDVMLMMTMTMRIAIPLDQNGSRA